MKTVIDRWGSLMLSVNEAEHSPLLTELYIEGKKAKTNYLRTLNTLYLTELDVAYYKLSTYLKGEK